LKALVNFLGTPQRRDLYREHAELEGFASFGVPAIPGDTWVASYCRMIRQCVFNYQLLESYFRSCVEPRNQGVFNNIHESDWDVLEAVEAICDPLTNFSMSIQTESVMSS